MGTTVKRGQLQNHWTGATAGEAFFARVASSHPDSRVAAEVGEMAVEVTAERESLRRIMLALGVAPSAVGTVAGRAGEFVGRFKPNGRIVRRSPLSDIAELEALRTAVSGKLAGWQVLRSVVPQEPRLDAVELDALIAQAVSQLERLERLHLAMAVERWGR